MSVKITGPALSAILFELCNSDGDREGFLRGTVTKVTTSTISDSDLNVVRHEIVYNIHSFIPVYGVPNWRDRKGTINENALMEVFEHVDQKEIIGWYKLRWNSSMQLSIKERAIHRNLTHWFRQNDNTNDVLFLLGTSHSNENRAVFRCDHQYFICKSTGVYENLPETLISLGDLACPNYRHAALHVSSPGCSYNHVLYKCGSSLVNENNDLSIVGDISHMSKIMRKKLKSLSESVLDSEKKLAKELAEVQQLRTQVAENQEMLEKSYHTSDGVALSTAVTENVPAETDKSKDVLLMSVSSATAMPVGEIFNEAVSLLDTDNDDSSSHQTPCLIPAPLASISDRQSADEQRSVQDLCQTAVPNGVVPDAAGTESRIGARSLQPSHSPGSVRNSESSSHQSKSNADVKNSDKQRTQNARDRLKHRPMDKLSSLRNRGDDEV